MLKAHCKLPFAKYFPEASCNSPGANGVIYRTMQPAQEEKRSTTRFDCALILEGEYNDCALSPQPRAWPNSAACNGLSPSSICYRCEGGVAFHGNDPAGGVRCAVCDGTGQVEVCCALCGEYGATDRVGDEVFHVECAEEWLADEASREEYPDNGPTDPWETSGPGRREAA